VTDRYSGRTPNGDRPVYPRRDRAQIEAHVKSREKQVAEGRDRARERQAMASVRRDTHRLRGDARGGRRLAIIAASVVTIVLLAWVVVPPLLGGVLRGLAEGNPDLMRIGVVADAVESVMGDRPDTPAGTDPTPVDFMIEPNTGNQEIVDSLVARELVTDRLAFNWVLAAEGGLDNLRAGRHLLNRTMSPREVAAVLQGSPIADPDGVPVALNQGLRLEQIVAYLQTLPLDNFDAEDFYSLAATPTDELREEFGWLRFIPEGRSLEGFLGAGIFDVAPDIDAAAMLETLLRRYEEGPSLAVLEDAESRGVNVYEMVTLASIVEREAVLDAELALIAGVYQNRLDGLLQTRLLQADPVVIYAKDTMNLRELHISEWPNYRFWTLEGISSMADFVVADDLAGYQVYDSRGLPPGPICTPGTLSLEAALSPDQGDGYLFFLAKGDGSSSHAFARTYEEHLRNIDLFFRGATPTPGLPTAVPSDLPTAVPAP
jgi:UPF0755 protein